VPPEYKPSTARSSGNRLHGVASAEEIQPDTLAQRIENEHRAVGGTIVWDLAFLVEGQVTVKHLMSGIGAKFSLAAGSTINYPCAFRRMDVVSDQLLPQTQVSLRIFEICDRAAQRLSLDYLSLQRVNISFDLIPAIDAPLS
jgi:hypothetical protein